MSTQAEKFKAIADAIRGVNDRKAEYTIVANDFASEIAKLDPKIVPYTEVFDNGYYGIRAAQIAATYLHARIKGIEKFAYQTRSLFSSTCNVRVEEYASIDCSTYVGLCLRGIPYDRSPYVNHPEANAVWEPATELADMYESDWWNSRILDTQPRGYFNYVGIEGCASVRSAAHIGEFFYKNGYILYDVAVDGALTDITNIDLQPGDLIFESDTTDEEVNGRFKSISHVRIVSENPAAVYHVTGTIGRFDQNVVYYSTTESIPLSDIVLICRPDYRPRPSKVENPIGVNLLGYPWTNLKDTNTYNGLTFTVVDMHSFTVNGTATANAIYLLKGDYNTDNHITLTPGTYELTGIEGRTGTSVALQLRKVDSSDFDIPVRYPTTSGVTNIVTVTEDTDVVVRFYCSSGRTISNETITPTLKRIDAVVTPETLLEGVIAYNDKGERIVGTMVLPVNEPTASEMLANEPMGDEPVVTE